jgi:hypothetical protein
MANDVMVNEIHHQMGGPCYRFINASRIGLSTISTKDEWSSVDKAPIVCVIWFRAELDPSTFKQQRREFDSVLTTGRAVEDYDCERVVRFPLEIDVCVMITNLQQSLMISLAKSKSKIKNSQK